jgi:3-deoxy-D-manno-octulosonic-acid transferase
MLHEPSGENARPLSDIDPASPPVILADTTGELMGFYGNAQIVFVGKSLYEHGAQNMIEPCLCGAATLVGPYTENFRPVMSDLLETDALIQVPDEATLAHEIERLMSDAEARRALGARGTEAVLRRKGVVDRCAEFISA